MKILYCSLFDHRYLTRALAMYDSLKSFDQDAQFLFLTLDKKSEDVLREIKLRDVTCLGLEEFLNATQLESVKNERPWNEFCFTCTPFLIDYCLRKYHPEICVYVDADIFFFDSPQVFFEEFPAQSDVLITEHRYSPGQDQTESSGRFCVQFVVFRNTDSAGRILNRWKEQCYQSCAMDEKAKTCGDQKYLDEWPELYPTVHILKHNGAVGPWNIESYKIRPSGEAKLSLNSSENLIFYHFHALKFYWNGLYELTGGRYHIDRDAFDFVYRPYIQKLFEIRNSAYLADKQENFLGFSEYRDIRNCLKDLWRRFGLKSQNYVRNINEITFMNKLNSHE